MPHNLVVGIRFALEKCETLRRGVLGVGDLTLNRNLGPCSPRLPCRILENPPASRSVALVSAQLALNLGEGFHPLVPSGLLEELRTVIAQRGNIAVGGDGLEMVRKDCLCVLLRLVNAAAAE